MNQRSIIPTSEKTFESQKKNANVIAIVLLVTLVTFDVFSTINYFSNPNTFLLLAMLLSYAATGSTLIFTWLIRSGSVNTGTWGIILTTLAALFLSPFLGSGLGLIYGITAIVVTSVMTLGLDQKQKKHANYAGIGVGIATFLLDLILPSRNVNSASVNNNFTFIILAILIVVMTVIIARQFTNYSLRNKLLVGFISVTLITAGILAAYVYISTTNILREGLERELTQHTEGIAVYIGSLFNEQVNMLTALSQNTALQQTVDNINKTYEGDAETLTTILNSRDAEWRAADASDNNFDPLVREYLNNQAALALKEFQKTFPDHVEIFITDVYGGQAGTTNRTSDYYQADEDWWQTAYNEGQGAVYISEPSFDASANALAVLIALPIRNDSGRVIGILRTTYRVSALTPILDEKIGQTGETDLYIPAGDVIFYFTNDQYTEIEPEEYNRIIAATEQGMTETDFEGNASVVLSSQVKTLSDSSVIDRLGWVIVFHQNQEEAFAPIDAQIRGTLFVTVIILLFAAATAFGVSLVLVRPILQLTSIAEEVAQGNLNTRAKVTSTDEVGVLAATFNSMTTQLQETLQGLEERVTARTKDLATVAEVGTATSSILETNRLLQAVVDLTKERFGLYHSHVYLLDEKGENLVLAAGAGEPGRVMAAEKRFIPVSREQSLVARAARERKGVTVNDVTLAPDFLPNPLLPNTRSELAVPMLIGNTLIGVFDIQADTVGRFTESDVNIQTTLASQLASSVQNARSYERSKAQADFEALVNTIGQKIQRSESVEETLQTAIRELGSAIGASRVRTNLKVQADEASAGRN